MHMSSVDGIVKFERRRSRSISNSLTPSNRAASTPIAVNDPAETTPPPPQQQHFINIINKLEKNIHLLTTMMQNQLTTNTELINITKNIQEDLKKEKKTHLQIKHQHYIECDPEQKNRQFIHLIKSLKFNQAVVFVNSTKTCSDLEKDLKHEGYDAIELHELIAPEERVARFKEFKQFQIRILVTTNLFSRRMDIERADIIFNYDMPQDTDTYLQRVKRRFGTKGLAITYVADDNDVDILNEIQSRFEVEITEMPDEIDAATYCQDR